MLILPQSAREWCLVVLFTNVALAVLAMLVPFPVRSGLPYVVSGIFILAATVGLLIEQPPGAYHLPDIWHRQRQVMGISGQPQPPLPVVNKHTYLYYALILEEHSETAGALYNVIRHQNHCGHLQQELVRLGQLMHGNSVTLHTMSENIRRVIAEDKIPDYQLPRHLAKPLLDGHVDTAVTVAGFGVASGLPGPEAYEAVQVSNLSKANPLTGKIDVDASGKWIKGVNYQPPQLDKVLDQQQAEFDQDCQESDYYAHT